MSPGADPIELRVRIAAQRQIDRSKVHYGFP